MTKFDPHRYTITVKLITIDGEDLYEASVAELPDVFDYGETYEEAYLQAIGTLQGLYETASESGKQFPEPLLPASSTDFSGRVTLRMAKSLHAAVSRLAERDGVSLNSWIVESVALRVGGGVYRSATDAVGKALLIHGYNKKISWDWVVKNGFTDAGMWIEAKSASNWTRLELNNVMLAETSSTIAAGADLSLTH
jgi:predicted HicB family RNase H-like nuclease